MEHRVILYHKQATSARTRFLKLAHDSVCAFEALPKLAQVIEGNGDSPLVHPTAVLRDAEKRLGLESEVLKAESEYRFSVDVPGESIQVLLAEITCMDPPFEAVGEHGLLPPLCEFHRHGDSFVVVQKGWVLRPVSLVA